MWLPHLKIQILSLKEWFPFHYGFKMKKKEKTCLLLPVISIMRITKHTGTAHRGQNTSFFGFCCWSHDLFCLIWFEREVIWFLENEQVETLPSDVLQRSESGPIDFWPFPSSKILNHISCSFVIFLIGLISIYVWSGSKSLLPYIVFSRFEPKHFELTSSPKLRKEYFKNKGDCVLPSPGRKLDENCLNYVGDFVLLKIWENVMSF